MMEKVRSKHSRCVNRWLGQGPVPFLLLAVTVFGCGKNGPELAPISGRVTFQGKAVSSGTVRLSNPSAGVDVLATLQPDGTYVVRMGNDKGLPKGTYAVAVVPPRVDAPVGAMASPPIPKRPDIPERYRDPSSSGLTLVVESGENVFDIDMRSDRSGRPYSVGR